MLLNRYKVRTLLGPQWISLKGIGESGENKNALYRHIHENYAAILAGDGSVVTLGAIESRSYGTSHDTGFELIATPDYHACIEAADHDLIYCTERHGVDYTATIAAWLDALTGTKITKARVERIKKNDLTRECFQGFGVTLMTFLVTCSESKDSFWRDRNWTP